MLIDGELLIDLSPDIFWNVQRFNVDFTAVRNILFTHSHTDHLNVHDLLPSVYQQTEPTESVGVYGNAAVLSQICDYMGTTEYGKELCLCKLVYGESVQCGAYKVTALPSLHMNREESMVFLIEKDGKHYFHCYDTETITDDTLAWLKENGIRLDIVSFDMTYGLLNERYFGHMNLEQVAQECARCRQAGIFTPQTKVYATHICHWEGSHEELEEKAKKYGIEVAYDGLQIDI